MVFQEAGAGALQGEEATAFQGAEVVALLWVQAGAGPLQGAMAGVFRKLRPVQRRQHQK